MLELKNDSTFQHGLPLTYLNDANASQQVATQQTQIDLAVNRVSVDICDSCKKSAEKLFQCKNCKRVKYCNIECQKTAWKAHQFVCKNSIFIPQNEEVVCYFQEDNGSLTPLTQKDFKLRVNATYVHHPLFSTLLRKAAKKYADEQKTIGTSVIPQTIALIHQGLQMNYGIIAAQNIKPATQVCGFGGVVISEKDWKFNPEIEISNKAKLYSSGGYEFVFDPSKYTSLGAIINDGPPNCEILTDATLQTFQDGSEIPLEKTIVSIKDILKGDILYVDYGVNHPIKQGVYHLDDQSLLRLYQNYETHFDLSPLLRTGWIVRVYQEEKCDPTMAKSAEIEYILNTPYALAKLFLNRSINPLTTLAALSLIFQKITNSKNKEELQIIFNRCKSILIFLSKVPSCDREAYSDLLETVSQYSFVKLCCAFSNSKNIPLFQECEQFCKAFDKMKKLFLGTLNGSYWNSSEKTEFEKLFFSEDHQKELFNHSEIQILPKNLKQEFKESFDYFFELVSLKLDLMIQLELVKNKNLYSKIKI